MSKSLIKANRVALKEEETLILDTNDLIAKKMEELRLSGGGFLSGLAAQEIEELPEPGGEAAAPPQPAFQGPSPEELIAGAKKQIERMLEEAREQAESMKRFAADEGRQAGYRDGRAQAMAELEKERKALKKKEKQLDKEYRELLDRLEPQFIETLTGIYEEIFKVDLAGYKPILLHAIENCMRNAEGARNLLVHVSREDYEAVAAEKASLSAGLPSSAFFEVTEDMTLGPNQCLIETSNGIYDCSVGEQAEELGRRLRLLAYDHS